MKITERKLRRIIRNVIREAAEDSPIYDEFPADEEGIEMIPADLDLDDDLGDDYSDSPFGMGPDEREDLYNDSGLNNLDPDRPHSSHKRIRRQGPVHRDQFYMGGEDDMP